MQVYLINALIFCGVVLLIALTVAIVQLFLILLDVRGVTKEVRKKTKVVSDLVDASASAAAEFMKKSVKSFFKRRRED
jgi:hypothetical protein